VKTLATPAEFETLMAFLDHPKHLDGKRQAAIARMVFEVVSHCPICDEGVRRCDARRLVGDHLIHLSCVSDAGQARRREGEVP
jgi:hypothetical protein